MNNKNCAPLVSVYVATYNQEKYLRDCLDGIVMQKTNFPFEALIIDDCSSDSNPEIIREYARRYPDIIRPFLLKENYFSQRKSKIYEVFFPNAKGKYIAFCEGDDYWTYDGKLQAQVDFLEAHPDYSMCCHNYKIKNESTTRNTPRLNKIRTSSDISTKDIIIENIVQTATIVARIDMLTTDIQLRQDIINRTFNFTDIRFFLSYVNSGKIRGINKEWSVYRINNNGIYSIDLTTRVLNQHKLLDSICKCYDGKFSFLKPYIRFHKELDYWTLNRLNKNYIHAVFHLIHAFILSPKLFIKTYYNRYLKF